MANGVDDVTNRAQVIEEKVDRLSASVDARFNQVDAAILEQRQYTEFAYSRLDAKMEVGFGRLGRIERKLDQFIDAHAPRRARKRRR